MLIRVSGYNAGVKEYLEEGVKNGRDYTRDELDERLIIYGDLDLTEAAYRSIPDRGQNRYTTFTLSFKEDEISEDTLKNITKEMRDFIMYAYDDVEYNFYAEAHIPKLKTVYDKRTGEKIERKPHIHIVIPKINLLSGNVSDVIGDPEYTEKYLEAFQEYINKKYGLASPREHVRVNPYNASDVLSRYKGDDFRAKNREFKQALVKEIIDTDIRSREGFYAHVATYGETKIVNAGKDNEYIKVKLPGDEKYTTLKETIFNDSFITERKLSRPPLPDHVITERLQEWPMHSKEIKYIAKASAKTRNEYYRDSDIEQRIELLSEHQFNFYEKYGGSDDLHPGERERDNQRGLTEAGTGGTETPSYVVQGLSGGDVAALRESGRTKGAVFLPGKARVRVAGSAGSGDAGLRSDLPGGTERRATEGGESTETGRQGSPRGAEGEGERGDGAAPQRPDSATGEDGRTESDRKSRTRGESAYPEAGESTGTEGERRASASPGREADSAGERTGEGQEESHDSGEPDTRDAGLRESQRYSGIPGMGQHDAAIRLRGGYGTGRLETMLPVYAQNGFRVPDTGDIERNTKRLSDSIITPAKSQPNVRLIRRIMPRAPRNASYLAASLQRRQEQSNLSGGQRQAMYRADQTFFDSRRKILSDKRLTTKDKSQLLGVLTFERLKAHQLIIQPAGLNPQESRQMGSEDIRKNIRPERAWRNYITAPEEEEPQEKGAKDRFAKMTSQIQENLGERSIREKVRIITAADLYTRKSRLSENIHYLDKQTDKTLFIDTGKAIAVSKNGLSDSGVAVAVELAKEKFGSTLNVRGTKAFKNSVIEVVAQKGLDVHFTDKEMNRRLAERKEELAIERQGQSISSAESAKPVTVEDHKQAFSELEKDYRVLIQKAPDLDLPTLEKEMQTLSKESLGMRDYWMSSDIYTPEAGLDKACVELEYELMDVWSKKVDGDKVDTYFTERASDKPDFPSRSSEFEAAYNGIIEAYAYLKSNIDALPAEQLSKHFINVRLERLELASVYISANHAPRIAELEKSLKSAIDARIKAEPVKRQQVSEQPQAAPAKAPDKPQTSKTVSHTGILLEHGAAPYRFEPDMTKPESERADSYFVKLQTADGKDKTVWGVTLAKAVENLSLGENVRLTNKGKEAVEWTQTLENGEQEQRKGERVKWEGYSLDRDVSNDSDVPLEYQQYEQQFEESEQEGPSVA